MALSGSEPVIVVMEGDRGRRNGLVAALQGEGRHVVAAATGAQALAICESRRVSLVIAGANLHGLSGDEVRLKVREREARQGGWPMPFITLAGGNELAPATGPARTTSAAGVGELLARVQALLNGQRPGQDFERLTAADTPG